MMGDPLCTRGWCGLSRLSPVVQALGVGLFGKDFGWHFAATVLTAHAAFGIALAGLLELRIPLAPFPAAVRNPLP